MPTSQQTAFGERGRALKICHKKLSKAEATKEAFKGKFVPATKGSLLDQCIEARLEKKK
jgi:hypothetical protein